MYSAVCAAAPQAVNTAVHIHNTQGMAATACAAVAVVSELMYVHLFSTVCTCTLAAALPSLSTRVAGQGTRALM